MDVLRQEVKNRFSKQLLGDPDGLFMSNNQAAAQYLASRIHGDMILELCCGIGATTIALAQQFRKVYAVDSDPERVRYAQKNAALFGINNVDFIVGDALDYALVKHLSPHAVFADPDWSPLGEKDKGRHTPDISLTQPPTNELYNLVKSKVTPNIVLRTAPCVDTQLLQRLGPCELESIFMNEETTPSFLYVYFGALIRTQGKTQKRLHNIYAADSS